MGSPSLTSYKVWVGTDKTFSDTLCGFYAILASKNAIPMQALVQPLFQGGD